MKVAVVGGGSTYTPELVDGVARLAGRAGVSELVLIDPDSARLDVVGPFSARIMRAAGHPARLRWTADLDDGLDGAGAVLLQLRIGGQAARQRDETWPLDYGRVGQETTGAGGFAKALRTVPVVLDIAERARRRAAPGAWIIDFTNPVGVVTRALLDAGHRAVGLCNVAIGFQRAFARLLDVEPERIVVDQVGLNHLTWVRAARVDGRDVLPELLAEHGDHLAAQAGGLSRRLLEELGAVPSYYLRYFYAQRGVLAEQQHGVPRAETVAEIERELLELYRDPALAEKPALLEQRGGAFYSEAAIGLVRSLVAGTDEIQVVDIRNNGTLAGLQDDDVVEVPVHFDARGAVPLQQPPLAPELLGLVQHVAAYERLACRAAVTGDQQVARKALLSHPLVGEYEIADDLLERLLSAGAEYLERFRVAGGA